MDAVKFTDLSTYTIGGWGCPYGGPWNGHDLDGEHFDASTDFCENWFSERPLIYNHGLDAETGTSVVGRVKAWERRDKGLWVQAQLDAQGEYFDAIKQLVDNGALFYSSGAMSHLVKIESKTGAIKRWPWVELSLTPTPSNLLASIEEDDAVKHFKAAGIEIDVAALTERATAQEPTVKAVGDGAVTDSRECSYEDIMGDLRQLLNPSGPFSSYSYSSIVATYPTYVIAVRYEYDGDGYDYDPTYWKVAYTIGDDMEPRLGEAIQIEQTYIPATKSAEHAVVPLSLDAQSLTRHAAVLVERTQDLHSRRTKEGRVLSDANRRTLADAHEKMGAAHQALSDLLDATDRAKAEAAKAAQAGDPTVQQRLQAIRELELAVLESYLDA